MPAYMYFRSFLILLGVVFCFNVQADELCENLWSNSFDFSTESSPSTVKTHISNLQDYEMVSEDWFGMFSTKDIAEGLVDRVQKRQKEWLKRNAGSIKKQKFSMKEADILLFFSGNLLPEIANKGFLNFHQTNNTRGANRSRNIEDNFVGLFLPKNEDLDFIRPKSAYLNSKINADIGSGFVPLHEKFGQIAAKMKDDVKSRALITNDDSLAVAEIFKFPDIFRHLMAFDSNYISKESLAIHDYHEVLIFGELDLSSVDYFLIYEPDKNSEVLKLLKSFGLPVYEMVFTRKYNRFIYHAGKRL